MFPYWKSAAMDGCPCHFSALLRKAPGVFSTPPQPRSASVRWLDSRGKLHHHSKYTPVNIALENPPWKNRCVSWKKVGILPSYWKHFVITKTTRREFSVALLRGVDHVFTHPAWTKRHHWHHHTIWNAVVPTSRELDSGNLVEDCWSKGTSEEEFSCTLCLLVGWWYSLIVANTNLSQLTLDFQNLTLLLWYLNMMDKDKMLFEQRAAPISMWPFLPTQSKKICVRYPKETFVSTGPQQMILRHSDAIMQEFNLHWDTRIPWAGIRPRGNCRLK